MTVDKAARRIQGGFLTGPTQFKYQKENHQLKTTMYKVGRFCWENFHSCPLISSIQPLFHVSHWNWHLYRSSAAIDPPGKLVPLDLEDAFCLPSYGEIVKNTLAMQFFSNVLKLFGFCE